MGRHPAAESTPRLKRRILRRIRATGYVVLACEESGISPSKFYRWRRKDPDFDAAVEKAMEEACDGLEQEAWRRAREGVYRDIYYKGEVVGEEVEYSDSLMQFLLKGRRRRVYGDKVAHVGDPNDTPIRFSLNIDKPEGAQIPGEED